MAPSNHPFRYVPRAHLAQRRKVQSLRASSFDRTGGNRDFVRIEPGETSTLLHHDGPGCITHLYCAFVLPDIRDYRNAIVRCYWDGSATASVQVPLGDFFGIAHCRVQLYTSQAMVVNPGMGTSHGLNSYLPMPFDSAHITLENRGERPLGGISGAIWYHIDYECYDDPLPADVQRFHATYRQERPATPVGPTPNIQLNEDVNLDGAENYVALDTTGQGRMVGVQLQIDNLQGQVWYGEGDDMVFVDGEPTPRIHGTGTEEIFGGGASPTHRFTGPYAGFHLVESPQYNDRVAMYRWYLHDPIHFDRSLRWTVEHGHANNFANDYSSVAYWYQEPLAAADPLPAPTATLPRLTGYDEAWAAFTAAVRDGVGSETRRDAGIALYEGRWDDVAVILRQPSP